MFLLGFALGIAVVFGLYKHYGSAIDGDIDGVVTSVNHASEQIGHVIGRED